MDSSHARRHRSWFLAVISSVVLFLGSVVFATSASAQGTPRDPGSADQGKSATAHSQAAAAPRHPARSGAHPSGHTTGGGGSAVNLARPNHFQAQADPDGMTNGGVDQPGGTGGVDTSSQDGNNGSGNDADCEDDNRGVGVPGHCKVHTNQGHQQTGDTGEQTGDVTGSTTVTTTDSPVISNAKVPVLAATLPGLSTQTAEVSAPGGDSSVLTRDSSVAGISTTGTAAQGAPAPTAGILPNTGASPALLALLVAGLAALVAGGGLLRRSRANA